MQQQERERLYKNIVENAPDAVIFADRSGVIQVWNGGAEAVFGYTAQARSASLWTSSFRSASGSGIGADTTA